MRTSIIQELGDTANPYAFELTDVARDPGFVAHAYEFGTEAGTRYVVDIEYYVGDSGLADIDFRTVGGGFGDETGEHDQFRIMATVVAIMEEYVAREAPRLPDAHRFEGFAYVPVPRRGERNTNARSKLYRAFAQNRGYDVHQDVGGEMVIYTESSKISELGETVDAYDYRLGKTIDSEFNVTYYYEFANDLGAGYEVVFRYFPKGDSPYFGVSFTTQGGRFSDETEEHDHFRIVATVASIVENFKDDVVPDIEEKYGTSIRGFLYEPVTRKGEENEGARSKLYRAFANSRGYDVERDPQGNMLLKFESVKRDIAKRIAERIRGQLG